MHPDGSIKIQKTNTKKQNVFDATLVLEFGVWNLLFPV